MKKLVYCLLCITFLWSCKKEAPVDYAILSGTINNTNGVLAITSNSGFSKTINVKDNGVFTDTLYIDNGLFTMSMNKQNIHVFLTKGSQVQFTVNGKEFGTSSVFSGNHTNFNNYHTYKAQKEEEFNKNREEYFKLDEAAFEAIIKENQEGLLKKIESISDVSEAVKTLEASQKCGDFLFYNEYRIDTECRFFS
ncbi:hypothetical protein [Flavivirga sp. 57AJ16]|uniref:hypothetical protein n=1 Tax=Flavivirga sp. 57AJ16 TaxID=3025307 RepID=UPI0023662257|nr:hypothetical protein [Flavivirga sp. 57AJ16]MDD7885486.1 hypothetical protein [Flavivirga sp. 57AJ16]